MALAIFYDFGEYKGTAKELAEEFEVTQSTMKGRLDRLQAGKIGLDRVLVCGKVVTGKRGGNAEWRALLDPLEGRPGNLKKIKIGTMDHIARHEQAAWTPSAAGVPVGDHR